MFAQSRYEVVVDTLVFDMSIEEGGFEFTGYLEAYDVNLLKNYIFEYPEIETLKVTGLGGFIPAARRIAEALIRCEIYTVAYGECYSACTVIFLVGQLRTLEVDAKLGFHKQIVDKRDHKSYLRPTVKKCDGAMSLPTSIQLMMA